MQLESQGHKPLVTLYIFLCLQRNLTLQAFFTNCARAYMCTFSWLFIELFQLEILCCYDCLCSFELLIMLGCLDIKFRQGTMLCLLNFTPHPPPPLPSHEYLISRFWWGSISRSFIFAISTANRKERHQISLFCVLDFISVFKKSKIIKNYR